MSIYTTRTATVSASLACLVVLSATVLLPGVAEAKKQAHTLYGRIGTESVPSDSAFITEFNIRRTDVESRIGAAATEGRITATQAADLRSILSAIIFRRDDYAGTGRISPQEQRELMADLARLSGTVSVAVKGPQHWM